MLFHFFLTIAQSSAGKVSKLNHRQGKRILIVLAALLILPIHSHAVGTVEPNGTYCNPMNLENYLADPCLVEYKNEYYLCGPPSLTSGTYFGRPFGIVLNPACAVS